MTTFILVLIGGLYSIGYKEVEAAEQCTTYTNYYLLLDATNINIINNNFTTKGNPYQRNTSKYFNLGVSRDAKNEIKKVIEINTSTTDTDNSWSLETFYSRFNQLGDNIQYSDPTKTNTKYIRATIWYDENGEQSNQAVNLPTTAQDFRSKVPMQLRTPTISDTCDSDECNLRISRSYASADVTNITEGTVFSPAVYMIQYDVCQEVADPAPTYNVIVNFIDKENNTLLPSPTTLQSNLKTGDNYNGYTCRNDFDGYTLSTEDTSVHAGGVIANANVELKCYYIKQEESVPTYKTTAYFYEKETNSNIKAPEVQQSGLKTGDTYNKYTCPEIAGYTLSTNDAKTFESGTIENKNIDFPCYYVKNVEKEETPKEDYTLTINFGTNNDCSQGTDIRKSETSTYTEGTTISYAIPSIDNYEFSNVGSITPTFSPNTADGKLTFTMPSKNTSICLVYIENKQTGAGWIYLAWIIGISALAYSGWYFAKYYKNQNTEV